MSRPAPGGIGREQILAQIAVLGEVRNSGPRDKRFQQWRQITTTLLQRMWPDDAGRAQEFCRIQFGVSTILPNPRLMHEHFEKGCNAAEAYLNALVKQMEGQPAAAAPAEGPVQAAKPAPPANPVTLVKPVPETPSAPAASSANPASKVRLVTPTASAADAPMPAHVQAEPLAQSPVPPPAQAPAPPPVPPEVTVVTQAPVSPAAHAAEGAQPRLKDMLGLGELTLTPNDPIAPPAKASTPAAAKAPRSANRAAKPAPVVSITPAPAPRPKGQELTELAAQLETLGVPAGDAVFISAALIDLGRQAGTSTPSWSAVRDTIAMSLAHPRLARRLLPLLMPYMDAAA